MPTPPPPRRWATPPASGCWSSTASRRSRFPPPPPRGGARTGRPSAAFPWPPDRWRGVCRPVQRADVEATCVSRELIRTWAQHRRGGVRPGPSDRRAGSTGPSERRSQRTHRSIPWSAQPVRRECRHDTRSRLLRRRRPTRRRDRHPGTQRAARRGSQRPPAARASGGPLSVPHGHHDRGQRQHRRHLGDRDRAGHAAARRTRRATRAARPRPRAEDRVEPQRGRGARLHGRGPVHRPQRAPAAACRATYRVLRRAVRVQSHHPRRRRPAAAAGRGHRLVLRHRAAGARRAERPAHPRGPGGLGRRPGQPGAPAGHRLGRPARRTAAALRSGPTRDRAASADRAPARRHGGNPAVTAVDELVRPDATPLPLGPVRARGWLTGGEHDPRWVRPALLALLAGTAALYILGLGANGWANSFYTAAVQAGTQSWKAFFFGSFDAANFITVDKPPGSLWLTGLSARMFGVNAWSILVPQALAGVATVGLLYLTVRRHFSATAGLLAGAVLALTPVATLMFRYNNPDALLALFLVAGAYAVTRAVETASPRWLALAGVLVGFGFLTKTLQALLVVPAFAVLYLLAAPTSLGRRLGHLVLAGVAMLVAGGWWVAAVTLWPAASRPFIGGSQDNSEFNLIFGYNGFGRLTGNVAGSVGGGPAGTGGGPAGTGGPWGATGVLRLFGAEMGGQIAWLLPAAVIFLVALLWLSRRSPRTDGRRAALVLWGGWLLVTAATFSFANGIIHPYYNVALAPAIGALVGIGAASLWPHRRLLYVRGLLIVAIAATGLCSFVLLSRSPNWQPWLRPTVLALALVSATAIAVGPWIPQRLARRVPRRLAAIFAATAATAAIVGGLAGPAAYSVQTAATAATGPIPAAGPAVAAVAAVCTEYA